MNADFSEILPRDEREIQVAYAQVPGLAPAAASVQRAPDAVKHGAPVRLAVQGCAPGAGQSTVILGLAIAWASLGRRVVILDLDPTEDLARLLHVGWSLRPGNAHTLANALRMREPLVPAPSLLPGVAVGSLGRWPGGHPAELAHAWRHSSDAHRATIASGWRDSDIVLVDLPAAAGMPALGTLANRRLHVAPVGRSLPDVEDDASPRLISRWRDEAPGAGAWIDTVGYPPATADIPLPHDARWLRAVLPDLRCPHGAWDLVDGRVGEEADHAFRLVARELDARGDSRAP